jgi:hypothetical protein
MMGKKEKIEELKTIYEEMDDEGKEKVILVVEEYLFNKTDDQKKRRLG